MNPSWTQEDIERALAERKEQGLPEGIEDPAFCAKWAPRFAAEEPKQPQEKAS